MRCPKCNSNNIITGKKGFGYSRAAVGGLLLGPIGLLFGGTGRNRIQLHCISCDHIWDHSRDIEKAKEKQAWQDHIAKEKAAWKKTVDQWKNIFKG